MPAYFIAIVHETDEEGHAAYSARVPDTISQYGGHYLVRGGDPETLEDSGPRSQRTIVLEFPDRASIMRWYQSPEYANIKGIRQAHSRARVTVVDGIS